MRLRWSLVAAAAYARDSSETISLVEEFISRPIASFDRSRSNFFYFRSVYRNEIVVSVWLNEHSPTERTYADVNFYSTRMNKKWKNHRWGIKEKLLIEYLQPREICVIRLPLPLFFFFSFFSWMDTTYHGKVVLIDPEGWHSVVHSLPRPDALQLLENKLIGETLPVATTQVYTACEHCFTLRQLFREVRPSTLRLLMGLI